MEAGIKYELRESSENFVFDLYGGHSPVGKRIFVLNSELERAKDLLGIKESNFVPSRAKIYLIFKIFAFIITAWIIFAVIFSFILTLKMHFNI